MARIVLHDPIPSPMALPVLSTFSFFYCLQRLKNINKIPTLVKDEKR
jgi:hypothetical protein